jgi:ribosome production factor 2
LPFEDATSLEFFSKKHDASLFAFGNHSKKRPDNLIIGRTFNNALLDMVEFGVENYEDMVRSTSKLNMLGSKPLFLFQGDHFVNNETMKDVQNVLLDFFNGERPKSLNLLGVDHVIVFTATSETTMHFSHYRVNQTPTAKSPKIELENIGPSMDLRIKRTRFASDQLKKDAFFVPQALRKSKNRNKNITFDELGAKEGRIHVRQEKLDKIALRRFDTTKRDMPTQTKITRKVDQIDSFEKTEQSLRKKKKL